MKNKIVAAFSALIMGYLGIHKWYLGNSSQGAFRFGLFMFAVIAQLKFLMFVILLISLIEAISLFSMSQREFDAKYNNNQDVNGQNKRYAQPPHRRATRQYRRQTHHEKRRATLHNPHKKRGIEYYKDYDYQSAISEFHKALEVQEEDIATHFNLACAYSLTEEKEQAFQHLDRAVELGFLDTDKIHTKKAFAYLRVQPEFEDFVANGFRIRPVSEPEPTPQLAPPKANLLDDEMVLKKLERLGDLRDRGIITSDEFLTQKQRLLDSD